GESARAALMTRGYAEMVRMAVKLGANPETLAGLSGFGDLALTCTSDTSRNYRFGLSLGRNESFDPSVTVEGAATARAASGLANEVGVEMPITNAVAALSSGSMSVQDVLKSLLARPLKEE
ncbi:MAG: glycerol-3-phosphate dehydrogenase, partial [Paracoccaceae bacterium]|nr:glycerol-3-phosphate dehydrogenase [Paracoccaceae bacterium]